MRLLQSKIQYHSLRYRRFIGPWTFTYIGSALTRIRFLSIISLLFLVGISVACSNNEYSDVTKALESLTTRIQEEAIISKRLQDLSMNATAEAIVYGMIYPTPTATAPHPTSTFRPPPTPNSVSTKTISLTPTISPPTPIPIPVPYHTPLSGWVTEDTVLSRELSPYLLDSDVSIAKGVTLTIRPGVTLSTQDHGITVYGALRLIGNEDLPIRINGRHVYYEARTHDSFRLSIKFKETSTDWDETKNRGNHFSYVLFDDQTYVDIEIGNTGIKIDNCTLPKGRIYPRYSDAVIEHNNLGSNANIQAQSGVVDIKNNEIAGDVSIESSYRKDDFGKYIPHRITDNVFRGPFRVQYASAVVWGNTFYSGRNSQEVGSQTHQITFANSQKYKDKGIYSRIKQNAFIDMHSQSVGNGASADIDLTDNWWGTIDSRTIGVMLYDKNDQPSLGRLIFDPYLNAEPGSEDVKRMSAPNKPTSTPGPQKCSPSELNAAFSMYGALSKNEVVTVSAWLGQEKLAEKEGLFTSYGLTIPICDSSGHTRVGKELTIKINGVAQVNRLLIQKNVSQKMDY